MRVWHPDRFQGDDRLRLKAEAQAQRINAAMSELRKMGKEPPLHRQSTRDSATAASNRTQTDHQRPSPNTTNTSSRRSFNSSPNQDQQRKQTQQSSSYLIAPMYVRQKLMTSFLRVILAGAIFYVAYNALKNPSASISQEAASLGFIFLAIDLGIRNLALMLLPKPVISIERNGLFFLKTGRLGWADIESAWPVMTSRYQQISLMLSQHYLRKRNLATRTLLRFRRWAKTPHIVIPFNGLTADPISVINAMRLRQLHQDVAIEEPDKLPTGWIIAAWIVSLLCVSVAIFRCLMELSPTPTEYIPYFALFGLCRAAGMGLRILKS